MRAKKLTARLSMPAAIAPAELLVQSSWFRAPGSEVKGQIRLHHVRASAPPTPNIHFLVWLLLNVFAGIDSADSRKL